MAAADVTVVEATLKEGWTQENLEVQFLKEDKLLENIGVKDPDQLIGEVALTPVWTGRGGGFTMVPSTGTSEANKSDPQKTAQAKWHLRRAFNSVEIDSGAIKATQNKAQAVARVVDTEVEGTVSDTRKQIVRQLVTDQSGVIASCKDNGGSSNEVPLDITGTYGLGIEATRQGWLPVGQEIDIGTLASEGSKAASVEVTAYDDSETEPSITISGSAIDTEEDAKFFISIANSRSGSTSISMNGFRNMCDPEATFGELNPETEPGWVPAFRDDDGGDITRQRVISGRRKVRQRGINPDWAWTSLKQVEALENETYPQVRFNGTDGQNTGDGESIMIGNLKVQAHEDCPDGDFTYVKKDNVFMIRDDKPTWLTQTYGNGILMPSGPRSTFLYGSLEWYIELGCNRRNAVGQFIGLS